MLSRTECIRLSVVFCDFYLSICSCRYRYSISNVYCTDCIHSFWIYNGVVHRIKVPMELLHMHQLKLRLRYLIQNEISKCQTFCCCQSIGNTSYFTFYTVHSLKIFTSFPCPRKFTEIIL